MDATTRCPLCGDTMTRHAAERCRSRPTSRDLLNEPESNWDSLPEFLSCDGCGHAVYLEEPDHDDE